MHEPDSVATLRTYAVPYVGTLWPVDEGDCWKNNVDGKQKTRCCDEKYSFLGSITVTMY
jgi:hypothetical protein